jgi:hypothetical protein
MAGPVRSLTFSIESLALFGATLLVVLIVLGLLPAVSR